MNLHRFMVAPPLIVIGGIVVALVLAMATSFALPEHMTPDAPNTISSFAVPIKYEALDREQSLADVERGRAYYAQLCSDCHGSSGKGDGVWAYRVTPRPVNLTSTRVQDRSDEFLFDVISDGLIGTPMSGQKDRLSEVQRRQIVTYLRHLGVRASFGAGADT